VTNGAEQLDAGAQAPVWGRGLVSDETVGVALDGEESTAQGRAASREKRQGSLAWRRDGRWAATQAGRRPTDGLHGEGLNAGVATAHAVHAITRLVPGQRQPVVGLHQGSHAIIGGLIPKRRKT